MMRVLILTLVSAVSAGLSAAAQGVSDSALTRCARTTDQTARLRCYDRLAGRKEPSAQSTGGRAAARGGWIVRQDTNPLDDSKTVVLALTASEGRSGLLHEAPTLILRCKSSEVEAYIAWNNYMGSDASLVTSRIGTEPPEQMEWTHSTDEKSTFYPGDVTKLIQSLLTVDRLVAQATPYSESPVTAVFVVTGLANAVAPLREACGLK